MKILKILCMGVVYSWDVKMLLGEVELHPCREWFRYFDNSHTVSARTVCGSTVECDKKLAEDACTVSGGS